MRFNGGKQMNIKMLKGKIHRATVVQAELEYIGRNIRIWESSNC